MRASVRACVCVCVCVLVLVDVCVCVCEYLCVTSLPSVKLSQAFWSQIGVKQVIRCVNRAEGLIDPKFGRCRGCGGGRGGDLSFFKIARLTV